ncbi:hypothetical protein [Gluconobacter morbifer]|uniref:Lipoprotein n=1 Tax=Gluconobacter morbifer G707 TaxID=1088869 RepID=G6XJX3_9PROT|nr:hypothetical protein [Gluconobacter morbifer]EHH67935.1 hypothetical protein GMO_17020 [Gluconobacter morbifer G707]
MSPGIRAAGVLALLALGACQTAPPMPGQGKGGYVDGPSEASPYSWGPIQNSSVQDAQESDFDDHIPR